MNRDIAILGPEDTHRGVLTPATVVCRAIRMTGHDQTSEEQRRRRRRFAAQLAPLAVGAVFADEEGGIGAVGIAALAQGIGLAVALVWLAAGRNPLSRR